MANQGAVYKSILEALQAINQRIQDAQATASIIPPIDAPVFAITPAQVNSDNAIDLRISQGLVIQFH